MSSVTILNIFMGGCKEGINVRPAEEFIVKVSVLRRRLFQGRILQLKAAGFVITQQLATEPNRCFMLQIKRRVSGKSKFEENFTLLLR